MLRHAMVLLIVVLAAALSGCGDVQLGAFTPAAPSNLDANVAPGTGGAGQVVVLTWTPSKSSTLSQGASFKVYRGTTATGTIVGKTQVATGIAATAYTDASVLAAGTYFYQVTASLYGLESAPSNEVSIAVQGANTSLTLTGNSASALNNLSWNAQAGATGYLVYRGVSATGTIADKTPLKFIDAASAITSFVDTGVTVGTTYFYQVVARFDTVQSALSNEIAIVTK